MSKQIKIDGVVFVELGCGDLVADYGGPTVTCPEGYLPDPRIHNRFFKIEKQKQVDKPCKTCRGLS